MTKSRLKVGYVTTSLSSADGWGRYSLSLISALSEFCEVKALTDRAATNETGTIPCIPSLPKPRFEPLTQALVFAQCLKHLRDCDIIHVLVEPYALGAALACRVLGKKFVMTLHGTFSVPEKRPSLKKAMLKFSYDTAAVTTTGSVYTEKKVREVLPLGECRFIPNGVNDSVFYPSEDWKDERYLLTVGAVKPRKGADLVVEALGLLRDQSDLKYKIVGMKAEDAYVRKIRDLIEKYELQNRVEFVGRVDDEQLRHLYSNCTAFVLAAREEDGKFEGFPMVFYEANACGAPVISTSGFGSEYAIQPGINGFIAEQNNPTQLSAFIKTIASDPTVRKKMRQEAIRIAQEHTWSKVGRQIHRMYQEAIH